MRYTKYLAALAVLLCLFLSGAAAQGIKLPPLNIKEYKLRNGLTVVMHQDPSVPLVAVNLWYHVGSKNEAPGRTGFAHLFEHMMFQGSRNYIDGWRGVDEISVDYNGTTNEDRTWYYEQVPSNFLERTLYLEADRLGNLLGAMDQAKLDNQRDVVKNERRQGVDNAPYGTLNERMLELMHPAGHPYSHSVIGSMTDLSAASLSDVESFFRQYYVPNNTVLVLSGDFDEKQARTWIQKYFGPIKPGAPIQRPKAEQAKLNGIIRKVYEDPFARVPLIALYWHSTPRYSADEAAMDILADVLSAGRGSRLQRSIVFGKELATGISAGNPAKESGGFFQISAQAAPGKSLDDIEKEINLEIEAVKRDGPTADEVSRAIASRETNSIYSLQTVFGKGRLLADFEGYLGRPNSFQQELDRYHNVTPADVKRVANLYLGANHLVMSYLPAKAAPVSAQADKPVSTETKKKDKDLIAKQDQALPKPGPDPKFAVPPIQKTTLSNGLDLWLVEHHELPIVSMNMVFNAGAIAESADRAGVASMTSSMLNQGTKKRSSTDISNSLLSIGASMGPGASWDANSVSLLSLTANLDKALDVYADVITGPTFPENEFAQLKRRTLSGFNARKANGPTVADMVYYRVLYGDQPYSRPLSGNEKTVGGLSRQDIVDFYNTYYIPDNATLIVVGDVQMADIKARLENAFAGWKGGTPPPRLGSEQAMVGKPGIYFVDKPGSTQSSLYIGQVGIDRSNPDYYAVQVMNSILGGGSSARLFMNLREEKGYTYGAYSRFIFRRGPGPFIASGEIQTVSTKEALQEFMKELTGIRGARPITPRELEVNKLSFIRAFPSSFETVGSISNQLANLVIYDLPDTYFNDYIQKINAVTIEDVNRVANKYLDPSKMAVVIVGDRSLVESKLKDLNMPITVLDVDGNPVTR